MDDCIPSLPQERQFSLLTEYKSVTQTYSQQVFPIGFLIHDFPKIQEFQTFQLVKLRCIGLRKCSNTSSESGFWVAFSVGFIEHLSRKSTPKKEVLAFIACAMGTLTGTSRSEVVMAGLESMLEAKEQETAGLVWMQSYCDNLGFWEGVQYFAKLFVQKYVAKHTADFPNVDPASHLSTSDLLPHIPYIFATAFDLRIFIYSPLKLECFKTIYTSKKPGTKLAKLHLFCNENVYHVLYSKTMLEIENYSIDSCSIRQDVIPPEDLSDMFSETELSMRNDKNAVERLLKFDGCAQEFIKSVFDILIGEGMSDFFTEALVKRSKLFIEEFKHFQSGINAFLTNHPNTLRKAIYDQFLAGADDLDSFQAAELFQETDNCEICHVKRGMVRLECTHIYCRLCITTEMKKIQDIHPFILRPDGETIEELICPIPNCYVQITASKFLEIIGDELFNNYLVFIEQNLEKKWCFNCKQTRHILLNFRVLCECKEPMCEYCYCDYYRRNNSTCICGVQFGQSIITYLKSLTRTCGYCMVKKSVVSDFSSIECDGHILCQYCLELAGDGKCKCLVCNRKFCTQEIVEIQHLPAKNCFECKKECHAFRLNTSCGCVICIGCAFTFTAKTQKITNCFSCELLFTDQVYNQLMVFLEEASKLRTFPCFICKKNVFEVNLSRPNCDHFFHKTCFEQYTEDKIRSGYDESALPCPILTKCDYRIQSTEMMRLVNPEIFARYKYNFKHHCPKCSTLYDTEECEKKSSILCIRCNLHFCVTCSQEYEPNHDPRVCNFNKIQDIVRLLEAAFPPDAITQCPGCKYPLIFITGTNKIRCPRPACGIHFCPTCATPTVLFANHGREWHRPSCTGYVMGDRNAGGGINCFECLKNGRECKPPRDLRTRGRFALDEM